MTHAAATSTVPNQTLRSRLDALLAQLRESASHPVTQSFSHPDSLASQSITFPVAGQGASKLAVVGPTEQEAGPFHEDPCRVEELKLRATGWGMAAV